MKGQVLSKVPRLKIPQPDPTVDVQHFHIKSSRSFERGSLRHLFFRPPRGTLPPELFNSSSHLPEIPLQEVRQNTCLGVRFGQCLI